MSLRKIRIISTRFSFTCENGRSLATASGAGKSISYAYDASGLCTGKTVDGVTHTYYYASGKLLRETYGSNILDFFYDQNGQPFAFKHNGVLYYYITNLQGDVIYILDGSGATVATYEYDPFGNIVSQGGSMATINPLRYRGYYYDAELDMYYLQSRYYDPNIGRFINADAYVSTGQSITGYNMFTYCLNNPINYVDGNGQISHKVTILSIKALVIRAAITYTITGSDVATLLTDLYTLIDIICAIIIIATKGAALPQGLAVGTIATAILANAAYKLDKYHANKGLKNYDNTYDCFVSCKSV